MLQHSLEARRARGPRGSRGLVSLQIRNQVKMWVGGIHRTIAATGNCRQGEIGQGDLMAQTDQLPMELGCRSPVLPSTFDEVKAAEGRRDPIGLCVASEAAEDFAQDRTDERRSIVVQ